jgi:hypothetical protein
MQSEHSHARHTASVIYGVWVGDMIMLMGDGKMGF